MSNESSESDIGSSSEDIELTVFSSCSDSGTSLDFITACRGSTKQIIYSEDEDSDVSTTFLHISGENLQEYDTNQAPLCSLENASYEYYVKKNRLSSDRQESILTRKALSLEETSIKRLPSQDQPVRYSKRKFSSLDHLVRHSTREDFSQDSNHPERPSIRKIFSLNNPKRHPTSEISSSDDLKVHLTKRASFLNPLDDPSTRKASSLHPLDGPLTRKASSMNPLDCLLTRKASSMNTLESPLTRKASSMTTLESPLTRKASSMNPMEGSSTKRFSYLDPLEGPSTRGYSHMDPLEGPLTRRILDLDPLEGPSNRRVWLSDSVEGSLTNICQSHCSVSEGNESLDIDPPGQSPEQDGYLVRALAWLIIFLRRYSRQIRHSTYYPLFPVAVLFLMFYVGYLGSRYFYRCDGCPVFAKFMYYLSFTGVIIVTIWIANVLTKRYFAPPLTGCEFCLLLKIAWFVVCFFLPIAMMAFYICEPVFYPPNDRRYCDKRFYQQAAYLVNGFPFVFALCLLIIAPGWTDPAED